MENNNVLPSAACSDAVAPMPEETVDKLKIESPEPASAAAENSHEASGYAVLEASVDRSAGLVPNNNNQSAGALPNDTQLQLVLRNAHPLQDTSLSFTERVNAFNILEREGTERRAQAKGQACQECGKKHPPPHLSKEQASALNAAYREGKQLRQQLQQTASSFSRPSQNSTTGAAPSAPSSRKGKTAFCNRCAKWHPGGTQACRTPPCVLGCGLHHSQFESCSDALRRVTNVIQARGWGSDMASPIPSFPMPLSSAAASSSGFGDGFAAPANSSPDMGDVMRHIGTIFSGLSSLVGAMSNEKRPAAEPAGNAGPSHSKKKKKKTGQVSFCQGPQSHHKGPPKPDDKGKGRAGEPEVKPEPAWE